MLVIGAVGTMVTIALPSRLAFECDRSGPSGPMQCSFERRSLWATEGARLTLQDPSVQLITTGDQPLPSHVLVIEDAESEATWRTSVSSNVPEAEHIQRSLRHCFAEGSGHCEASASNVVLLAAVLTLTGLLLISIGFSARSVTLVGDRRTLELRRVVELGPLRLRSTECRIDGRSATMTHHRTLDDDYVVLVDGLVVAEVRGQARAEDIGRGTDALIAWLQHRNEHDPPSERRTARGPHGARRSGT